MSDTEALVIPFVRDTMLPPAPPPGRQGGVVAWLRQNLLSGPVNIALTVLGALALWWIVTAIWPWLSHGVWNASSLAECRSTVAATWGEGATGACWAVIRDRWKLFVFGFYPSDLYWRPVLAFGLLFVALAPVLFAEGRASRLAVVGIPALVTVWLMERLGAPTGWLAAAAVLFMAGWVLADRRPGLLALAALLYPFAGCWLLWGGSFWTVLMVLAALPLALIAYRVIERAVPLLALVAAVAVAILWWGWVGPAVRDALNGALPLAIRPVASDNFGGFLLAITIGVAGIALSLPLGIILALGRRSALPVVKLFSVIFIEFIRGVPLITLLFVASLLLNYFLPPGTNFDIILRVIIMVTLFSAAYMAEVIRGGLAALPKGQYEAADSLGLDYWKAQRLIVLPQALKISIPGIVSTFIGMFKDTTLVTFVGLYDPLKASADAVRASTQWKGTYWEPYIFAGAVFFIICFAMSRYSIHLEQRLKRDHR